MAYATLPCSALLCCLCLRKRAEYQSHLPCFCVLCVFFGPFFADNSFHSSLIVIRRLLACRFASPSHEIVFALTSHSHSMTSSALLIRFAIFRALDIYSTNSVNIVFLAGGQVSCDQSPS